MSSAREQSVRVSACVCLCSVHSEVTVPAAEQDGLCTCVWCTCVYLQVSVAREYEASEQRRVRKRSARLDIGNDLLGGLLKQRVARELLEGLEGVAIDELAGGQEGPLRTGDG